MTKSQKKKKKQANKHLGFPKKNCDETVFTFLTLQVQAHPQMCQWKLRYFDWGKKLSCNMRIDPLTQNVTLLNQTDDVEITSPPEI